MDALAILRADALSLTPTAARAAQYYVLSHLRLGDLWRSALAKTLHDRAGATPVTPAATLKAMYGTPGAWSSATYLPGGGMEVRLWLAAVQHLAAQHDPERPMLATHAPGATDPLADG